MTFATLEDLAQRASLSDLAEIAEPDDAAFDGAALQEIIDAGDSATTEQSGRVRRLLRAIEDATAEMQAILGAYHVTRVTAAALRSWNMDLAVYRLFGGDAGSDRHTLSKRALDSMEKIAKRGVDTVSNDTALVKAPERTFTKESLEGY